MRYLGDELLLGDGTAQDRALGELLYAENTTQATSAATATPGTTYLTLTTPRPLPAGDYLITAIIFYTHGTSNRDFYAELSFDGTIVQQLVERIATAGVTYRYQATLRKKVTVATGGNTHSVSLAFYASSATSYMQEANITLERV
jgi:hypothetical protein